VPEAAHKYVKRPDKQSKIHVGLSFVVPFSKLRPSQHNWSANIKKLINRIKGKENKPGAEESTSGQQLEHDDEAKPTPPNSGAQRGRSPTPPKQGGNGGGGKRKKGGSGGKGSCGKRKKGGSGGKA
jgi:hypothetical protein